MKNTYVNVCAKQLTKQSVKLVSVKGNIIYKKSADVQDLYTIYHGYFKREILAKSYCAIQMDKTCKSITECVTSCFTN